MPTPFYHLSVAEDLLEHPGLSTGSRHAINDDRSAFLLGNTAPDVQTVSAQERQATHFFDLPIRANMPAAWDALLAKYPSLLYSRKLPPSQAAFVAGYLCHLQADWNWVLQIFAPVFGPWIKWKTFPDRLYLHNVLRSYLDRQIHATLLPNTGQILAGAAPASWLPFVKDKDLCEWRDLLAVQLHPGAVIRTVEVFAERQGISPEDFYALLDSEDRMEDEVFSRLPRSDLVQYRQRLIEENVQLLDFYFQGSEYRSSLKPVIHQNACLTGYASRGGLS